MKPDSTAVYKKKFEIKIPNWEENEVAETVAIDVDVWKDEKTGDEILTAESLELIDRTKARNMGLMAAEEIKALRERLDLTQRRISELLQLGAKSYTRWESGKSRPSRSINVLLCALRDEQIGVDYLTMLVDRSENADSLPLHSGRRREVPSKRVLAAGNHR